MSLGSLDELAGVSVVGLDAGTAGRVEQASCTDSCSEQYMSHSSERDSLIDSSRLDVAIWSVVLIIAWLRSSKA